MDISKENISKIKELMDVFDDNFDSLREAISIAENNAFYDEVDGNAHTALDAICDILDIIESSIK